MPVIPEDYRKVAFKSQKSFGEMWLGQGIGPILSREEIFANTQCNLKSLLLLCFARCGDLKEKPYMYLGNMTLLVYFV